MRGDAIGALRDLLEDEATRGAALAALVPELPASGLTYAFGVAEDLFEDGRPDALRALAARVLDLRDPAFLIGTGASLLRAVPSERLLDFVDLAVAMPASHRWYRAEVLAAAAGRLAGEGRADAGLLLLELAERSAGSEEPIADAAFAVASAVEDRATTERLLAFASKLSPEARAAVLIGLAPRLSPVEGDQLRQVASEVDDATLDARLFAAHAGTLPEAERPAEAEWLIGQAAEVTAPVRAVAALGVAAHLPAADRAELVRIGVDAALEHLRDLAGEPAWRPDRWIWEALLAVEDLAEPDSRPALAEAMTDAARTARERERATVLTAIAARLGDVERPTYLGYPYTGPTIADKVQDILGGLDDDERPAVALTALAPQMAGPPPPPPAVDELDDEFDVIEEELDELDELDDLDEDYDIVRRLPSLEGKPSRPERQRGVGGSGGSGRAVVNTGFAGPAEPEGAISPRQRLHPGDWLFWLEAGDPHAASIETQPASLLASVPAGCTVTVVLYPVSENVEILDGRDTGELVVRSDGSAEGRLLFPIRIARGAREVELRCSIFRRQLLVQSRRVRALVADEPTPPEPRTVLTSDLDYLLLRRLAPRTLQQVPEHGLNLMLNGDGATHNLHALVAGDAAPITHSTRFEGGELQDMIEQARRALRQAAFGSPEPWCEGDGYRYDGPADPARLAEDLIVLAIRGFRFYDACINRLVGGRQASREFEARTARTTRIQIALKQHGGLLLPAALFYDHPLDTTEPDLRLCPDFLAALEAGAPLEELPCFRERCAAYDDVTVVCPSGFWGYRHDLGLPLSIEAESDTPALSFDIAYDEQPELCVAVSTDPRFTLRAAHEQELRGLRADLGWHYADTRHDAIRLMRDAEAQLLYFYCHGGITESNAPFLGIGAAGDAGITSDIFRAHRILWEDPRPLVFINGCHTTALEPSTALSFVSRLVDTAAATGVIGTEITTFEPLAGAFATACLRRFLAGEEIGAAVRRARLELLGRANPLGLIYVPFVLPSIRLVPRSDPIG